MKNLTQGLAFLICLGLTSVSWGNDVMGGTSLDEYDAPHRLYIGVFTEHYIKDDPRFNEKNDIQLFSLNVAKYTDVVERVYAGKMKNSYYDEGLIIGAGWEHDIKGVKGLVLEYGLVGTNSYSEDVIQSAPRLGDFVIAPIVGVRVDPSRLIDDTSHGVSFELKLAPAALNVGFSVPFSF